MEKINTEKRSEILDAAINLFSEKGFEHATVDEIAAKANVGKGTIYLYFENKEHIFLAIIEEGISQLHHLFSKIANEGDYLHQLRGLVLAHLQFVEDNRELYGIFMKERLGMRLCEADALKTRFMGMHQSLHQFIAQFMQHGMEQGIIRTVDPAYLGMAFSGIVSHFAFQWLFTNDNQPLTNLADTILTIFLSGVENKDNQNVSGGVSHVS